MGVDHQQRRGFTRNRIVRAATFQIRKLHRDLLQHKLQRAAEDSHRIAASKMDVHTGVPAFESGNFHPKAEPDQAS